jgi:hypothetical protein
MRGDLRGLAVIATGVAAALLVATMNPAPAEARPGQEKDCAACHGGGVVSGTVTAVPSQTSLVVNGSSDDDCAADLDDHHRAADG